MVTSTLERAVLLADITGSTALYEKAGDRIAARKISDCIDLMKAKIDAFAGTLIAEKGDDVLATFETTMPALSAIEAILRDVEWTDLSIHAGLHFGKIITTRDGIFGDTVNTTARLASLANPGEVLISGDFVDRLSPERSATLHALSAMRVKGKTDPISVFALESNTILQQTELAPGWDARGGRSLRVRLTFGDQTKTLEEGASITVGRAAGNDFEISSPWVSRSHATMTIANGRIQFSDHSSFGSYLVVEGNVEVLANRETLAVMGSGRFSPGMSVNEPEAQVIHFVIEVD